MIDYIRRYTGVVPPVPPSTTAKLCTGLRISAQKQSPVLNLDYFSSLVNWQGDYIGDAPPVPIPNTEVKFSRADDSVMNAKVGRRLTNLLKYPNFNTGMKYSKADGSVMNARVGSRHQRT